MRFTNLNDNPCEFNRLEYGTYFLWHDRLYFKLPDIYDEMNVLNLEDKIFKFFSSDNLVFPVEIDEIIYSINK